jgi:hypothetical protein
MKWALWQQKLELFWTKPDPRVIAGHIKGEDREEVSSKYFAVLNN